MTEGSEPRSDTGATRRSRPAARRTPDQPCLNCGDPTPGNYCPNCGQAKRKVTVSVAALVADVLEDQLVINRALPRTLGALIARPGLLTVEYINGRIVRYIAPFRLYLASSVVFFLLLSFFGLRALDQAEIRTGDGSGGATADSTSAPPQRLRFGLTIDTTGMPPEAAAAVAEAMARADAAGAAAPDTLGPNPAGLQPWALALQRDSTGDSGWWVRTKARIVARWGRLPAREAFREAAANYLEYVPHMVFLLLPLFALLLKLLYIRRRRYYAEHFVFALHVHAFTFLMFIAMFAIRHSLANMMLALWVMVYVWLAMKRVYGQGWFRTTAKYFVLGFLYFTLLMMALTGTLVVTVLLA